MLNIPVINIPMLVHLVIDYFANIGLTMEGFNHKIIDSIVIPSVEYNIITIPVCSL